MSYGGQRQAWAKINKAMKQPEAREAIGEIADEIEQRLKANASERYFDFSSDCTLLMNRIAEVLLRYVFFTDDTSEADKSMQNFACETLVNRAKFEELVLKYIAQKAKEQKLEFSEFFLRYYGANYHAVMADDNDQPIIKVREGETPVLKRYVMEQILFRFGKYDFDQLNDEELDILVKDIRQNFKDMKSYTRYELITFMHGREVSFSPPDNGDGEEIPMEYPADESWSPTYNDVIYLVQSFQQLVSGSNPKLTVEELQRAFVSIMCQYMNKHMREKRRYTGYDYDIIIHQASWMTESDREAMIQFIDRCMDQQKKPTVETLAKHLGIYTSDKEFSQAKDKFRKLLAEHLDVTYG